MAPDLMICCAVFLLFATLSQGSIIIMNARQSGLSPIHILSGSQAARERLCLAIDYQLISIPTKNPCQLICVSRMSAIYPVATRRYNVDDGAICGVNQICLDGSCVHDPKVVITENPSNYLPSSAAAITLTRPTLTTITPTQVISSAHSATERPNIVTTPHSIFMDIPAFVAPTTPKPVSSSLPVPTQNQTSPSSTTSSALSSTTSFATTTTRRTTTTTTTTTTTPAPTSPAASPSTQMTQVTAEKPIRTEATILMSDGSYLPDPPEGIPTPNIDDIFFFK